MNGYQPGVDPQSGFLRDITRRNRDIFAAPRGAYYLATVDDWYHVRRAVEHMGRFDLVVTTLADAYDAMRLGDVRRVVFDHELYQFLDEFGWAAAYRVLAMAEKAEVV